MTEIAPLAWADPATLPADASAFERACADVLARLERAGGLPDRADLVRGLLKAPLGDDEGLRQLVGVLDPESWPDQRLSPVALHGLALRATERRLARHRLASYATGHVRFGDLAALPGVEVPLERGTYTLQAGRVDMTFERIFGTPFAEARIKSERTTITTVVAAAEAICLGSAGLLATVSHGRLRRDGLLRFVRILLRAPADDVVDGYLRLTTTIATDRVRRPARDRVTGRDLLRHHGRVRAALVAD